MKAHWSLVIGYWSIELQAKLRPGICSAAPWRPLRALATLRELLFPAERREQAKSCPAGGQDAQYQERDLEPAQRRLALHFAGRAVDQHVVDLVVVAIGQHVKRQERKLEALAKETG